MNTPNEVVQLAIDRGFYVPGKTPYLCFELWPMIEAGLITHQEAQNAKDAIMHWLYPDITLYNRMAAARKSFTRDNVLWAWGMFYDRRQI